MSTQRFGILPSIIIGGSIIIAAGLFHAAAAHPPAAAPRPPSTVGLVDLGKVMDELDEVRTRFQNLKAMGDDAQKKLEEFNERLTTIRSNLEMLRDRRESPEYRKLLGEMIEVDTRGRARENVLQESLSEEEGKLTRSMYLKMADACERYARANGIDLVMRDDRMIVPPERVLHDRKTGAERPITGDDVRRIIDQRDILAALDRIDITADIIAMMNAEYKAGKP